MKQKVKKGVTLVHILPLPNPHSSIHTELCRHPERTADRVLTGLTRLGSEPALGRLRTLHRKKLNAEVRCLSGTSARSELTWRVAVGEVQRVHPGAHPVADVPVEHHLLHVPALVPLGQAARLVHERQDLTST